MTVHSRALASTLDRGLRGRLADYVALTKPRLNSLVVASAMAGYYLGTPNELDLAGLASAAFGTALVAGGSAAFNQLAERRADALMARTRLRPLADGRLQPAEAACFGAALSAAGLAQLGVGNNLTAMLVALATLAFYTLVYTPLKMRSWTATLAGAIPGALPPVIGWTAAQGTLSPGALALFGIVFCWQIPHFLAIAWLYRDEYARAGFPFLPVVEPEGHRTARYVAAFTIGLVIASLLPFAGGVAGRAYAVTALLLGLVFLIVALRFVRQRTTASARHLFLWSVTYLPLIWTAMMLDA